MKLLGKSANQPSRGRALLSGLANTISHPIWASYMPPGPGSLPTGQSGMAGRLGGPYIGQARCDVRERADHTDTTDLEFAIWN